jgi:hypothetical protein
MSEIVRKEKKIRLLILLFIGGLVLSGLTAFPIVWEMKVLQGFIRWMPGFMNDWYGKVSEGLFQTDAQFPFIAYGTDWLAFAHIIIALFFYAPLRSPLNYLLIVEIGIVACVLVFPLAFCCGAIRGIPFFWRLIDCSFGFTGMLLLVYIRKNILQLKHIRQSNPDLHTRHEKK